MKTQVRNKKSNLVKNLFETIQNSIINLKVKYIQKVFNEEDLDITEIPISLGVTTETVCPNYKPNGNCQFRYGIRDINPSLDPEKRCPYHNNPIDCRIYQNALREEFIRENQDKFFD